MLTQRVNSVDYAVEMGFVRFVPYLSAMTWRNGAMNPTETLWMDQFTKIDNSNSQPVAMDLHPYPGPVDPIGDKKYCVCNQCSRQEVPKIYENTLFNFPNLTSCYVGRVAGQDSVQTSSWGYAISYTGKFESIKSIYFEISQFALLPTYLSRVQNLLSSPDLLVG